MSCSNNPRTLLRLLSSGNSHFRLDKREFEEFRNWDLELGPNFGQASVFVNGLLVATSRVLGEIVAPSPDNRSEGSLTFKVQASQIATSATSYGGKLSPIASMAEEARRLLEKAFLSSRIIDPESLCILAGKQVWSLTVVSYIINDCGNCIDAVAFAALAALMHFRRQEVTVIGSEVTVHTEEERELVALTVLHCPILSSFGIVPFAPNATILADPSAGEMNLLPGQSLLTIASNQLKQICLVHKNGGEPLSKPELERLMSLSCDRALVAVRKLEEAISQDADKRRSLENRLKNLNPIKNATKFSTVGIDTCGVDA